MKHLKRISFRLDSWLWHPAWWGELVRLPASFDWPANFWSLLRLCGIFLVIPAFGYNHWFGLAVFIGLLYTDAIDGVMARNHHKRIYLWLDIFFWLYILGWIKRETWQNAGQWFDPLADKVFIVASFYYFGLHLQPVINPLLFYAVLIIEFSNRGLIIPLFRRVIMRQPLYIKANKLGKAKFITEAVVGMLIIFYHVMLISQLSIIINLLLCLVILLSLGSMLGHIFPEKFTQLHLLH